MLTMTVSSSAAPANDFHLHVSFRLVGDSTYGSQKHFLENLLDTYFDSTAALEHEDPEGPTDRELVYSIQKPVLLDGDALHEFFVKLRELFTAAERYLPAFTQSTEVAA